MPMNVECLVIGGGPAGVAAAAEAARLGVEVMVVEERKTVGAGLPAAGVGEVTTLTSSLVWGVFPAGVVGVVTPGESLDLAPRVTVIATGAHDRLLPFPGWEHPAVVTAGDALDLARAASTRLRWIVAGIGEVGVRVALALRDLGHRVVTCADASADAGAGEGTRALRDAGVEILAGHIIGRAAGQDRLEHVELQLLSGSGAPVRRQADFLCVAYGRQPVNDLAWLSGCAMEHRPDRGGYVPVVADFVTTSVDGVLVAGDAAGLCGAETAALEGRLAGQAAAERTGRAAHTRAAGSRTLLEDVRAARTRERAALAAWVPLMWELEDHYVRAALAQPDMLLCRCEQVTGRQVRAAVDDGALTPGDVKRATRAGMGECQGRHCRSLITRGVSVLTDRPAPVASPMSFRPPVRPVPIAQLIETTDKR